MPVSVQDGLILPVKAREETEAWIAADPARNNVTVYFARGGLGANSQEPPSVAIGIGPMDQSIPGRPGRQYHLLARDFSNVTETLDYVWELAQKQRV